MKFARRIFRTGFTCPYIADEIRPQKIFGQTLPVPYILCQLAQRFNVGEDFEGEANSETNFVGHGFMPCRRKWLVRFEIEPLQL